MDSFIALTRLSECGLKVDVAHTDGLLHRVPTINKPQGKNGWYICFDDVLVVGDWTTGAIQKFYTTGKRKAVFKRRTEKLIARKQAELEQKQCAAALSANNIYSRSKSVFGFFEYLHKKNIKPTSDMRFYRNERLARDELIIPLIDLYTGEICNIQRITSSGEKRFLAGCRVTGLCFPIGLTEPPAKLFIAEGVATAIALHKNAAAPTLAALNAGNLKTIATQARLLWPSVELTIAADDDYLTEQKTGVNPGLSKAWEAAQASLASVSAPPFTLEQKLAGNTDWNDYFNITAKHGRRSNA